jgi:hypothetical protein
MNPREHALLARQLVARCGGLREGARACRLSRSQLARFQDPKSGAFMPADVLNALEQYCGEALYSRALVDDRPTDPGAASLLDEACQTAEDAVDLQRLVRVLAGNPQLTPRQKAEIIADAIKVREDLNQLIATAEGD